MAVTYAVADLITDVRQKSDLELVGGVDNTVVSDSEIITYLNEGLNTLYDIVVNQNEDHYISSSDLTSDGTATLNLPEDFYRLKGVDFVKSTTEIVVMRSFNWAERNTFTQGNTTYGDLYYYSLRGGQYPNGDTLTIIPTPSSGLTFRAWYIPAATQIGQPDDGYAGHLNIQSSWKEYIVNYAAIECIAKEDRDYSKCAQKIMDLERRIVKASSSRDSQPTRINDLRSAWKRGLFRRNLLT